MSRAVEIACDESGYEGERLIGSTTEVFAHASVRLPVDEARRCFTELRERIRSPATEYKAGHILREKHRKALEWTLGPSSPLYGRARVYLVDKAYFVLDALARALLDEPGDVAAELYRLRVPYLAAANDFLRGRPVDGFLDALPPPLRKGVFRRSTVDPLVPAIVAAVRHWGGPSRERVTVVHDRTNTLSPALVARIEARLGGQLAGLRLADSTLDPRVQAADLIAGAARKLATDELHGRADERMTALLRPYLEPTSVWGDEASWSRLTGQGSRPADEQPAGSNAV
ncbi:hypothetical protein GCM10022251_69480 [Phytohabitans flavus]|uniref:DUF3800 domain-containing protein n=1 Tax=Phytohabitans flavus TaxID=1076124 RepID=A0A6F8XUU2_9ACTN|nr:NAD-dependent protein deacetylase of SIR2 family [Phytohabitans flavus]BCB77508.1 hypothetical protein Pflav_039180 [Phytohabitans flavus]